MTRLWVKPLKIISFRVVVILTVYSLGFLGHWIYINTSHSTYNGTRDQVILRAFSDANIAISGANNRCRVQDLTVGDVLGFTFLAQLNSKINRLDFTCSSSTNSDTAECRLGYSSCLPWQSAECGSRLLTFELDRNENIITSSYSCLEIP